MCCSEAWSRVCTSVPRCQHPPSRGAENRKPVGNEVQSPASCESEAKKPEPRGAQVPTPASGNEQALRRLGPPASLQPTLRVPRARA